MTTINRTKIDSFMRSLRGRAAGVTFIKKDGTIRTMNARLGVVKYLKGGRKTVGTFKDSYLTVWSFNDQAYRTVNLASVFKVNADGQTFYIS